MFLFVFLHNTDDKNRKIVTNFKAFSFTYWRSTCRMVGPMLGVLNTSTQNASHYICLIFCGIYMK